MVSLLKPLCMIITIIIIVIIIIIIIIINGNYNVNNRNSAMDIPRGGSSCPPFPGLMTFAMFVLVEGGKLVDPEKNPRSEEEN